MYLIGLTGNIATGKSTVRQALAERGAATVDADALAHEVMQPGTEVCHAIVNRFGPGVVRPDGSLDRVALRGLVFSDAEALRDLERIVHPAMGVRWRARLEAQGRPVGVVEAIKLIEAGYHRKCDELWVVTAPPAQQLARLMATRGLTEEEAWRIIQAQPPQGEKAALADVVFHNDGDLADLLTRVEAEWQRVIRKLGN
jgi:dephospho-CoA kinase